MAHKILTSRRQLLAFGGIGGAAALAWYAWPKVQRLIPIRFAFEPVDWPPGFRRISAGQSLSNANAILDLVSGQGSAHRRAVAWVQANPCLALFGGKPPKGELVPVAVFADYNCPYCEVLTRNLVKLNEEHEGQITISWHEWPILGQASEVMARAALAARRQGVYEAFNRALRRTRFLPDDAYLRNLAEQTGINPDLLITEMSSPEVAWDLATSAALARLLGFHGTPSLVVGRTAVSGAIGKAQLRALVQYERESGPIPGCA